MARKKHRNKKFTLLTLMLILASVSWLVLHFREHELFYPVSERYNRKSYEHWIDKDRDCQNTRHEVLIKHSITKAKLSKNKCRVISGRWYDPYTDKTYTDPKQLDIDHFIPLAEAHRSGAHAWSSKKKRKFANDMSYPMALVAVSAQANRKKSDKDPVAWLPPNWSYRCSYVKTWVEIKRAWQLEQDIVEKLWTKTIIIYCDSTLRKKVNALIH